MTLSLASTHTWWISSAEKDRTQREEKGRAGTVWKCVVGIGLLLWARTPLMRWKKAQQEAALNRTMPVILSYMNHLPSNTNKYCSNTSGSLRLTLGWENYGGSRLHTPASTIVILLPPKPYTWPFSLAHSLSVWWIMWSCWYWFSNSISPQLQQEPKWAAGNLGIHLGILLMCQLQPWKSARLSRSTQPLVLQRNEGAVGEDRRWQVEEWKTGNGARKETFHRSHTTEPLPL